MKQLANVGKILEQLQEDAALKTGQIIVIETDSECDSMLKDAYRLTADGVVEQLPWKTYISADLADFAQIFLPEDNDAAVTFHLTRPSGRDYSPNGIRLHDDELGVPCVFFVNVGRKALTLEGDWIEPGKHVAVYHGV